MKVLLGIDGSPNSHAALAEFATRPWPNGTDVQIFTVIHPSMPLFMEPTLVLAAAHMEQTLELRSHAPALMKAAGDRPSEAPSA